MNARGFPAFPAGPTRRVRSYWAAGWLAALTGAALDTQPLRRGRRHAARGHVGPITISPGRIAATVHDGDPEQAHHSVLRVDPLPQADWDRLTAALAARSGHLAALLAGQLPTELAETAGVRLLPESGQLLPECDCPDWDHPCRHAAALGHQVAWLLDAEPLLLSLIRGRDPRDLLAPPTEPTEADTPTRTGPRACPVGDGTPAGPAYAGAPGPLPRPPDGPARVTLPPLPPDPGVDVAVLRERIRLAADRAAALLADTAPPQPGWARSSRGPTGP
ncbi:hypothetical protein [Micromonospora halophytica]|uniref:SWIM-type domain-containing protein n=1 Tax=Micromonospora halophytica TaxID=47864 RepID=A0A1C5JB03_9ACTN|nr:hypothetical protein [Micromonospora halophytica]SCG67784.1 hypothetical protein GA0070560_12645 [Micromonospora halophytica]